MDTEIHAEIAATVLSLHTASGRDCEQGELLLLLESMKMEIPVLAGGPGTVVHVPVGPGTAVREGDVLAVVRPRGPVPG